jgi:hypothetical protein
MNTLYISFVVSQIFFEWIFKTIVQESIKIRLVWTIYVAASMLIGEVKCTGTYFAVCEFSVKYQYQYMNFSCTILNTDASSVVEP